ncbi:MAG: tyrosine-type recombinase/integrase [Clostridia bacterium]|nr:tyrosine-type recombinase/integrase [Clostridia bacterium]
MLCQKCKAELNSDMVYCPYCGKKQMPTPRKRRKRANGTGSIYKMPGNRTKPWAIYKGGVYVGYYKTEREAQDALERLAGRTPNKIYNYTFSEVYKGWSPSHFKDVQKGAAEQYERSYAVFKELHDRRFRDLRTIDFQTVIDKHSSKSVNTVDKYKQLITQMSEWAIENEIINVNYASYVKVRGRPAKSHEPLTDEEIKLIEADPSDTSRIVQMLLATGMRIGELFSLPLEDYHDTYVVGGEKTVAGRERIIPIRPEGRKHFAYFAGLAQEKGGSLLLDGYSGNKKVANFRRRDYKKLLERLGIDKSKTPHSTRTTYGTRAAIEDELSPATLQKVLGHKQFDTTQKYYNKPDAGQLVEAVEKSLKAKE